MKRRSKLLIAISAICGLTAPAFAQDDRMTPIATPAQTDAIALGTGPLPGATAPESWYHQYGKDFARNVTLATLTPYLPDPAKATGTAVIVAPGGGFRSLSRRRKFALSKRPTCGRAIKRSAR